MQLLMLVGACIVALPIVILLLAQLVTIAASAAVTALPSLIVLALILIVLRGILRNL